METLPSLWTTSLKGGIALIQGDMVIASPRFSDGVPLGGWWTRYNLRTGECLWRRKHRRGASLCHLADDLVIASNNHGSGVYAISLESGRRLWCRLGDAFDWLLKLFEYLPCYNEGDQPERLWNGGVLTRSGRLLDLSNGKILSRHKLDHSSFYNGQGSCREVLDKIDGEPVPGAGLPPERPDWAGFDLYQYSNGPIKKLIRKRGLELASYECCAAEASGSAVAVAKEKSEKNRETPHYLIVADRACSSILKEYELGIFAEGNIDFANEEVLVVTTRSFWKRELEISRRNMWMVEWRALH